MPTFVNERRSEGEPRKRPLEEIDMNKDQWHKAYHLARLSTCIDPEASVDEEAEVKASRQMHELIQSGFMTRKDFWAASDCVYDYRYQADKLDVVRSRMSDLRRDWIYSK